MAVIDFDSVFRCLLAKMAKRLRLEIRMTANIAKTQRYRAHSVYEDV